MRPHDIVVLFKILLMKESWMNKDLATTLFISPSEISESLNRSKIAKLISPDKKRVMKNNLLTFIENGLSYVFPVEPGAIVLGVPTAHSASVLKQFFSSVSNYVWADPMGEERGQAITPLYPNQVLAIKEDHNLYDLLALVDSIRVGRVREVEKALDLLKIKLKE